MISVTGWALAVWLKLTVFLAIGVGVAWLFLGTHSGLFVLIMIGAIVIDVWAARKLAREWAYEARSTWWGAP